MTDWPNTLISTAGALVGASVGGYAALVAVRRTARDAQHLAQEERRAAAEERKAELVRTAARTTRMIVIESILKFANVGHIKHVGFDKAIEEELTTGAEGVRDRLVDALHRYGYQLPDEAYRRVENLFHLVVSATYLDISTRGINHDRLTVDVRNFAQYVWLSLEAVERDQPLPAAVARPVIERIEIDPWHPDPKPSEWRDDWNETS